MPVKVEIPSPLREHTGGKTEVAVSGATVQAALDDLVRQFPSMTVVRKLLAVDASGERTIGEYTFEHTAYRPG